MTKRNIKIVIPARYQSTRLPGKPLVDISGTPMIVRVVQQVIKANIVDAKAIWVATDDNRVQDAVQAAGYQVLMTKTTHESGTDRVYEVAQTLAWPTDTVVINVQGDEPLIEPQLLREFADFCQAQTDFKMASVMYALIEKAAIDNPNVVKLVVNQHNKALYFSRLPIPFVRDKTLPVTAHTKVTQPCYYGHLGLYAYQVATLANLCACPPVALEQAEKLEQLRALHLGIDIAMHLWQGAIWGGVDTPDDVAKVTQLIQS